MSTCLKQDSNPGPLDPKAERLPQDHDATLESSTYRLKSSKDLDSLRNITEQRDQWRGLSTRIQEAAEVLKSHDCKVQPR
ncbi:hypothetical protein ElyMa_005695800 [Elysia marginata]|uniref:Uncharacterized protein n=1 Tax=Elysia marginata TaxID=1093978 RepID=A0AAV4FF67_9GAST|nr:hypothetical protein ElyMa_005695800 [Elysia marginata]